MKLNAVLCPVSKYFSNGQVILETLRQEIHTESGLFSIVPTVIYSAEVSRQQLREKSTRFGQILFWHADKHV